MVCLKLEPDWAFTQNAIVVLCRSELEARIRTKEEYRKWAEIAARFGVERVWLKYPNCKGQGFPVLAAQPPQANPTGDLQTVLTPAIHAERLPLTPAILAALESIAENPQEKWVLTRLDYNLDNQVQVAMTETCRDLVVGASVQQALNRKRSDYWDLADLDEFSRTIRQQMSVGSLIEWRWKGFSPVTRSDWREFTYRYRIIDDIDGHLWQLGQNVAVRAIEAPVSAR